MRQLFLFLPLKPGRAHTFFLDKKSTQKNQERFNRAKRSSYPKQIVPNLVGHRFSICGLTKSLGPARYAAEVKYL